MTILLNKPTILKHTNTALQSALHDILLFDSLPSTSTYLLNLTSPHSGTVCLSETQTNGRGRLGRSWHSPKHAGLYLSLLWELTPNTLTLPLTLMVGVAVINALQHYAKHNTPLPALQLKWPNDIVYHQQKVGGLLIERTNNRVVIGIGLNCSPSQEAAPSTLSQPYTDISTIMQQCRDKQPRLKPAPPIDRNILTGLLLTELLGLLTKLNNPSTDIESLKTSYLEQWSTLDALKYKTVTSYATTNKTVTGLAQGITPQGQLIIKQADGTMAYIGAGTVRLGEAGLLHADE